jgi:hypothetical protein
MPSKVIAFFVSMILLFMMAPMVKGQNNLLDTREIEQKFSQVWNTSQASGKNYSWKARTEVTRDNKSMQVLIEVVSSDQYGRQIR